jgi:AcrR family transcriptional regulator
MARQRTIDPEDVLRAAERVVLQRGAAGLSIDAVAKEAGISKSHVVYDYKTKSSLLEALVERIIKMDIARVEVAVQKAGAEANPQLMGRIEVAANQAPGGDEQSIVMAVCAAASNEESFQRLMLEWLERDLAAIEGGSDRPEASLMAFLALYGFSTIEYLGFKNWDESKRSRILAAIKTVFASYPEPDKL